MDITKRLYLYSFLIIFPAIYFSTYPAWAGDDDIASAKQLLEEIMEKMCDDINHNRDKIKSNPNMLIVLIENNLKPNISLISASERVVGKNKWSKANKTQRKTFIEAFQKFMLNFYSSSLREYLNSSDNGLDASIMTFYEPVKIKDKLVYVDSSVTQKNSPPLKVRYLMLRKKEHWKILDVAINGMFVLKNYELEFKRPLQSSGLNQLTEDLVARTQELLANQK